MFKLLIAGREFAYWTAIRITRRIDAVDTVDISAPFQHDAPWFRSTFRPFSYYPVIAYVDDAPLFTGTMLSPTPNLADTKTIEVSCYAASGVMADCTAPASALPLEFNKLTLKQIAERLAAYFSLGVEFRGDPGAAFDRVACEPDRVVMDFLADLAKQRGFIISSNTRGDLLFWKGVGEGAPVAILSQGVSPLMSVSAAFSPQDYYSEITGLKPIEVGKEGSKTTVKTTKGEKADKKAEKKPKPATKYSRVSVDNEEAAGVFRPHVFKIQDADGADVGEATRAKLARMIGNMAKYTAEVATWYDPRGRLWAPNTLIQIHAPDAMIYEPYTFQIVGVTFNADRDSSTATLELALPGSFSGEPPEVLPWD